MAFTPWEPRRSARQRIHDAVPEEERWDPSQQPTGPSASAGGVRTSDTTIDYRTRRPDDYKEVQPMSETPLVLSPSWLHRKFLALLWKIPGAGRFVVFEDVAPPSGPIGTPSLHRMAQHRYVWDIDLIAAIIGLFGGWYVYYLGLGIVFREVTRGLLGIFFADNVVNCMFLYVVFLLGSWALCVGIGIVLSNLIIWKLAMLPIPLQVKRSHRLQQKQVKAHQEYRARQARNKKKSR